MALNARGRRRRLSQRRPSRSGPDRQLHPARLPPATSPENRLARSAAVAVFRRSPRVCAPPSTWYRRPLRRRRRLARVLREDLEQIHAAHERVVVRVARGVMTHLLWLSLVSTCARVERRRTSRRLRCGARASRTSCTSAVLVGACGAPRRPKRRAKTREKAASRRASTPGRRGVWSLSLRETENRAFDLGNLIPTVRFGSLSGLSPLFACSSEVSGRGAPRAARIRWTKIAFLKKIAFNSWNSFLSSLELYRFRCASDVRQRWWTRRSNGPRSGSDSARSPTPRARRLTAPPSWRRVICDLRATRFARRRPPRRVEPASATIPVRGASTRRTVGNPRLDRPPTTVTSTTASVAMSRPGRRRRRARSGKAGRASPC